MSELQGLQSKLDEFEAAGYRIMAVSPDTVAENNEVVQRLALSYPILSDGNLVVTRAMGLVHEGAGIRGHDVPRPATFLMQDGFITWRDLTDNWRVRIHADDLLEVARGMNSPGN